ncbi:MAG: Asp-tRNA(Asn)/Glu-tRNA(Gln) amidotransferase subunit GatC [Nitrospinaceae bacterium]|jgi:aspartyl-tRNA(Asn)/glutamyl-tRNA(Gln) amidotransferase subunit C|nr:MAG: Asp-tRNA(Asn)/Glu-tRNA(Gln) amidotransferase subunit GatC [Nitrospinaceae bacterium]
MPASGKFDIDNISKLARIRLSASEKERLGKHLETIIQYIDHLNQLDTSGVEPTSHVLNVQNVFREDEETQPLPKKNFLALAPASDKGHYEVPKII